jgi:hypothetical protein
MKKIFAITLLVLLISFIFLGLSQFSSAIAYADSIEDVNIAVTNSQIISSGVVAFPNEVFASILATACAVVLFKKRDNILDDGKN